MPRGKFKKHIILHFNGLIHFDVCSVFEVTQVAIKKINNQINTWSAPSLRTNQNPASAKYFRGIFLLHLTN